MLGWALIINNLGRRRYPTFWWHPNQVFVAPAPQTEEIKEERDLERIEEGASPQESRGADVPEEELFQRLENEEGN